MAIERLKPRFVDTVTKRGMYPDGKGLYLQVGDGGRAKSWLFRFVSPVTGSERQMGLGPLHTIGLAEAREQARLCRVQLLNRIDPIEAREAARLEQKLARSKEVTFRHCAEGWVAAQERAWAPSYARTVASIFQRFIYPILGDLPVQRVDVDLVHKTVEWLHTNHPPTYNLAQMYIEGSLNWARAKGYVTGDNPASLKGPLGHLLLPVKKIHTVKHHKSLPWQRIGKFMAELRAFTGNTDNHAQRCKICHSPYREEIEAARREGVAITQIAAHFGLDGDYWRNISRHEQWLASSAISLKRPISAYALEFIILTAVRAGQAASARWKDIYLEERIWDCPPESHKAGKTTGKAHIVPLSDAAMAIITTMKEFQEASGQDSEFVFPGQVTSRTGYLSTSMINLLMKQYLKRRDCVPHGFRSTFKTWSVEHGYDERDSEMALAHTVGNNVRNSYVRDTPRIEPIRRMMQAWADHCARTEPLDAKIIPMRQAKNGEPA